MVVCNLLLKRRMGREYMHVKVIESLRIVQVNSQTDRIHKPVGIG